MIKKWQHHLLVGMLAGLFVFSPGGVALHAADLSGGDAGSGDGLGAPDPVLPRVTFAVDRGLAYLASQQNRNGMFPGNGEQCTALTALAILAFLSRGHVPGQGPYGALLHKSIDWVLLQRQPSGLLAGAGNSSMYDHGISTVMLCEVYGMVDGPRSERIKTALAGALRVILDAQRMSKGGSAQGGWRYTPDSTDSDISVSGWQIMALRGAANLGADVPADALQSALTFLLHHAAPSPQGGFGYMGAGDITATRTATGVLALAMLGRHRHPAAIAGGDYLLQNPFNNTNQVFYYYGVYYGSQAANQLGGKYWTGIYPPLRETLLGAQQSNGGWPETSSGESVGSSYTTAMAVLALNVPLRYLPLYQR